MIGVVIVCHYLDDYLPYVVKHYCHYDNMIIVNRNFRVYKEFCARNYGMGKLSECEYVWIVDADEFILKEDQETILKRMRDGKHDAGFVSVIDYYDANNIYPQRDHKPVVIVNPRKVQFYDTRCLHHHEPLIMSDINMHHLGFTFPEEKMNWKKEHYWDSKEKDQVRRLMKREPISYDKTPQEIKEALKC